jgi:hypothetical protein
LALDVVQLANWALDNVHDSSHIAQRSSLLTDTSDIKKMYLSEKYKNKNNDYYNNEIEDTR